ncbi:phage protease [Ensifer aridi]|uniref:phage protease n=1 Tax=Ensifer aridi TaxID=1708715 RepID=UPI000A0FD692|nr:phage protease [Ensifer aridi]
MKNAAKSLLPALVAAHATALIAAEAAPAAGTSWIMLLPKGSFAGRDGRGPYDAGSDADLTEIVKATLQRAGSTELVVDYDHQTMYSAVPGVGGRAPAAGWIKEFEVRDNGLWGRVEWTDAAAQAIRAGEYRYISPVYLHTKAGKVTRLISAALTNVPNLDLAAVAARADLTTQEEPMDKIALALGLAQGAGEDAILTAINAVLTSTTAIAAALGLDKAAKPEAIAAQAAAIRANVDRVTTAAGLKSGAKLDDVVTAIQSARIGSVDPAKFVPIEQVTAMQADIKALQEKLTGNEAEEAVNAAIRDGKLAPALKEWGLSLHRSDAAQFKAFIDNAPSLTAAQRTASTTPAPKNDALDETDLAVMRQMGLTEEQMKNAKKGGDA